VADIFISYKKEDRDYAVLVADRLAADGFSVWWDNNITPDKAWDRIIEEQIGGATCVVVLWTPRSIVSDWVRTEALFAQDRRRLVPAMVERCDLPLAFRMTQTVDLTGWRGDGADRHWRKLLTWVADLKTSPRDGAGPVTAVDNPFRDVVGRLPSGEAIVDGSFINLATPAGTLFQDSPDAPVMRVLPRGDFLIGAPAGDPDRTNVEFPQKRIDISQPFAMAVYQTTRKEFACHVQAAGTPAAAPARGGIGKWLGRAAKPNLPDAPADPDAVLNNVAFDEAVLFAERLSAATGHLYRLPSEAEWEYACRAGTRTRYACGDHIDASRAVFRSEDGPSPAGPGAPGRFAANNFGLFDMHGNVREWTADIWHESYETTPADGRPDLHGHGSMRVVRGGGWSDPPSLLRSSARSRATQSVRSDVIGFRLVRNLS
jgi:sulfatase modifying factor 1